MSEQNKIKIVLLGIVAVSVVLIFVAFFNSPKQNQNYSAPNAPFTAVNTTNATTTCTTVSSILLASSTSRNMVYFANEGGWTISLCFAGTCSSGQGYQMYASSTGQPGSFTMDISHPYWGPISCIVNTGGVSSTVGMLYNQ